MPERKGVLKIVDRHSRRRNAKAKRSLAEIPSAASQTFREQRNRAPFRRSASGPTLFQGGSPHQEPGRPGRARALVCARQSFRGFTPPLRNFLRQEPRASPRQRQALLGASLNKVRAGFGGRSRCPKGQRTEGGDWAVAFRTSTRPKNSESERNLSRHKTKGFATLTVSH
jgi:hypothetical protein